MGKHFHKKNIRKTAFIENGPIPEREITSPLRHTPASSEALRSLQHLPQYRRNVVENESEQVSTSAQVTVPRLPLHLLQDSLWLAQVAARENEASTLTSRQSATLFSLGSKEALDARYKNLAERLSNIEARLATVKQEDAAKESKGMETTKGPR